jgi:hypothetical protein
LVCWQGVLVLVLVLLRWEGLVRGSAVARLAATCRLMAQ